MGQKRGKLLCPRHRYLRYPARGESEGREPRALPLQALYKYSSALIRASDGLQSLPVELALCHIGLRPSQKMKKALRVACSFPLLVIAGKEMTPKKPLSLSCSMTTKRD